MTFKADWEECKKRFDAFWEGEILDRCCIGVMAPRANPLPAPPEPARPATLEGRWTDEKAIHAILLRGCYGAFFGGECFPGFFPNLGPGVLSAFLGNPYQLVEDTVWFDQDPMLRTWEDAAGIRLQPESPMWKAARRMTSYYAALSAGEYCVAMTDLGGNLDVAAALRGTETLLLDLYDHPREVEKLSSAINRAWFESYDELHGIIAAHAEGMSTWLPLWCRKRYYTLQCDFCAMISPSQFDRFVRPGLEEQAAHVDYSIYHLDGPGQLCHLDSLLDIERLTGIQWVPGAGAPGEAHPSWLPVYRRIQAKGKNLSLSIADPRAIRTMLAELSPEGLFLGTACAAEADARRLLDDARSWSRAR